MCAYPSLRRRWIATVVARAVLASPLFWCFAPRSAIGAEPLAVSPDFVLPFGGGTQPGFATEAAVLDGRLVIHGPFSRAGSVSVSDGPAAWTGATFSVTGLPSGITSSSQTVFEGQLAYGDAIWNGQSLVVLRGTESFSIVRVRTSESGPAGLLAAATIEAPAGDVHDELILWNGTEWTRLGAFFGGASTVIEHEGGFFAGGAALTIDGTTTTRCLRWDGQWTSYPELPRVYDYEIVDSALYASTADGLHRWTGSSWARVPDTGGNRFGHVAAWNGGIVAGGSFADGLGGSEPGNVAYWDGSTWTLLPRLGTVGPGEEPDWVSQLVVFDGELYACGAFEVGSQPEPAWGIARLVGGTTWHGLESRPGYGFDEAVHEIVVHEGALYAGLHPFGTSFARDGTFVLETNGWREISSPVRDRVEDLVSTSEGLVGVGFQYRFGAPGTDAVVERYANGEWELLARGTSAGGQASANTALEYAGQLVVGGNFDQLEGLSRSGIAAFDGTTWLDLGTGIEGDVHDMIEYEGDLVVTGDFWSIGGEPITHVARWDGTSWSPMGQGFGQFGLCLAMVDGDLYAGGAIQYVGPTAASYVARWTGTEWVPIPDSPNDLVEAMVGMGGALYVSGRFTEAGGIAVGHFAELDHATQRWQTPDFLPDAEVLDFHVYGNVLYLGGAFTRIEHGATAVVSEHVGRITFPASVAAPVAAAASRITRVVPNPANPLVTIRYELSRPGSVELAVYDARGRLVRVLSRRESAAGSHSVSWNGQDDRGRPASSGVYFARLRAPGGATDVRKLVLVR